MALPKLTELSTTTVLPVSGKEVRVFAYKISELKNLFIMKGMGMEHDQETNEQVEDALIDLVRNKVPDVNIDDLTVTDIVALFIQMVAMSSGTVSEEVYACRKVYDGEKCKGIMTADVDISKYHVIGEPQEGKLISIGDGIYIQMKYPTYGIVRSIRKYANDDTLYTKKLLAKCIMAVYDGDEVTTDFSEEEIENWVANLPYYVIFDFNDFLSTMPIIAKSWTVVCPECGNVTEIVIENLVDFFTRGSQERTK